MDGQTNGRKLARLCLPAKAGATKIKPEGEPTDLKFSKIQNTEALVISVTLSDYLFLCYWECKWALIEPFIVKGVRDCFITLHGKWNCIVI